MMGCLVRRRERCNCQNWKKERREEGKGNSKREEGEGQGDNRREEGNGEEDTKREEGELQTKKEEREGPTRLFSLLRNLFPRNLNIRQGARGRTKGKKVLTTPSPKSLEKSCNPLKKKRKK